MANADAHASHVLAEMRDHGAHAIIARMPAAALHACAARREVNLVMEHRHGFDIELIEGHGLGEGAAGFIIECCRFHQQDFDAAIAGIDRAFGYLALELAAPGPKAMVGVNSVENEKSGIVPVAGIFRARIALSCEDQHGAVSLV